MGLVGSDPDTSPYAESVFGAGLPSVGGGSALRGSAPSADSNAVGAAPFSVQRDAREVQALAESAAATRAALLSGGGRLHSEADLEWSRDGLRLLLHFYLHHRVLDLDLRADTVRLARTPGHDHRL